MPTLLSSILLVLWATTAAPRLAAAIKFSTGCGDAGTNVNITTLTLTASCLNGVGGSTTSTIPLDSCIGNDNGQLTTGINFSQSCQNISSNGLVITADCATIAGTLDSTSISLDVAFADDDGVLSCA
ncbi:hypothetical protein K438DRAFT_1768315 [Mycena galopus ATCC 62051]|nr:hypothetical protein K438DRAFT_1768315 [Mycena galopus ATCC 62051]